ncbi:MAG: nucleotide exchange factor GrpE [Myxococcota bacterium]
MGNNKKADVLEDAMQDALNSVERIERESSGENETQVEVQEDGAAPGDLTEPELVTQAAPPPEPQAELSAVKDQLLRLAADFDNFRKRTRREREEMQRFGAERLLRELLPIVDNMERALAHSEGESSPVVEGIKMVAKQFVATLGGHGVHSFLSVGQPFDPERHEALGQAPAEEGCPPGSILHEMEKGYMMHDRLLRPAKVVVAGVPVQDVDTDEEAEVNAT